MTYHSLDFGPDVLHSVHVLRLDVDPRVLEQEHHSTVFIHIMVCSTQPAHWHMDRKLEMTLTVLTNAGKHVTLNGACVNCQRYTHNSAFWLPKWYCVLWCYVNSRPLSDQKSFQVLQQTGCQYVHYVYYLLYFGLKHAMPYYPYIPYRKFSKTCIQTKQYDWVKVFES